MRFASILSLAFFTLTACNDDKGSSADSSLAGQSTSQGPAGPKGATGPQGPIGPAGSFHLMSNPVMFNTAEISVLQGQQVWTNQTGKYVYISGSVQLDTANIAGGNLVQANLRVKVDPNADEIIQQHFYIGSSALTPTIGHRDSVGFFLKPGGSFRLTKDGGQGSFLVANEWYSFTLE